MSGGILCAMEDRSGIVELTGALTGRYRVQDTREDGTVLLRPDTSQPAILDRAKARPATREEFERAFGDLPTGPA